MCISLRERVKHHAWQCYTMVAAVMSASGVFDMWFDFCWCVMVSRMQFFLVKRKQLWNKGNKSELTLNHVGDLEPLRSWCPIPKYHRTCLNKKKLWRGVADSLSAVYSNDFKNSSCKGARSGGIIQFSTLSVSEIDILVENIPISMWWSSLHNTTNGECAEPSSIIKSTPR